MENQNKISLLRETILNKLLLLSSQNQYQFAKITVSYKPGAVKAPIPVSILSKSSATTMNIDTTVIRSIESVTALSARALQDPRPSWLLYCLCGIKICKMLHYLILKVGRGFLSNVTYSSVLVNVSQGDAHKCHQHPSYETYHSSVG